MKKRIGRNSKRRIPVARTSSFAHPNWELEESDGEIDDLSLDYFSGVKMIPRVGDEDEWRVPPRRVIRSEGPVQNMMRREAAYNWAVGLEEALHGMDTAR